MRYLALLFICLASIGWSVDGGWDPGTPTARQIRYLTEKATTSDTITATESGKTISLACTTPCEVDLPVASPGISLTFSTENATRVYLDPNGTDTIKYATLTAGDRFYSSGTTGDSVTLISATANVWTVAAINGSWVDGN